MGKIHHPAGEDSVESGQTCPCPCSCPSLPHFSSETSETWLGSEGAWLGAKSQAAA